MKMNNSQLYNSSFDNEEESSFLAESPMCDIGVFWDYENVRIPRWCRTADAANAIRSAVIGHGRISERRLYYDSKKLTEQFTDRVNLDLLGFALIDCPARGRKETLDKKMIVDILGFAWERAARRIPTCVVLITSDGDYSYTVAKLRDIGVRTVVIYGERTTTADVLLDASDHAMSWVFDVLGRPTRHEVGRSGDLARVSAGDDNGATMTTVHCEMEPEGEYMYLPLEPMTRESSLAEAVEGRHLVLLNCVEVVQMKQLAKQMGGGSGIVVEADHNAWTQCWATDTQVLQLFKEKRGIHGNESNDYYKELKRSAALGSFIEFGRQDSFGSIHVMSVDNGFAPSPELLATHTLRPQQYIRLTASGRAQLSAR